jgi:hypothetical protein
MALIAPSRRIPTGSATPRIAPPVPVAPLAAELEAAAKQVGLPLWPWQRTAAQYLMAREGDRWRYREVCIVVARQNGKTTLLIPRILWGLSQGRRIVHTAQNREIPREAFLEVADRIDPAMLARKVRYANGQEKIVTKNGGSYRIVAPQRGARGLSADDLIIDEVREFDDFDFISASVPTLTASPDPQVIYLSNAGHDKSVVLNALRTNTDERMCYVEWSADPDLDASDPVGWVQANPGSGHKDGIWETLEYDYATKPSAFFETEHLCRWVTSDSPALVTELAWRQCQVDSLGKPFRPYLGIALDPSGQRASAALAWKVDDGIAYRSLIELDELVDVDDFGAQVRAEAMHHRVRGSAYSGLSDAAVARFLTKPTAVDGRLYANASANFATLVDNRKLRWSEADALTDDLRYTIRKDHNHGAWSAIRSEDSHPITAVNAAIRAVWLASAPKRPAPRIG